MLHLDFILLAFLFTAFTIEFLFACVHQQHEKEKVKDMKTNVFIGFCLISTGIFTKGMEYSMFSFCYKFAIYKPATSLSLWIIALFSCDFIHYLYHLLGHKTRLFWAAHVTHHSSQHFNLSTGWRINFIQLFYRSLFWMPLCFFGIPPYMVLLIESIITTHNFLIHTDKIKKLGWLDWLFNTPSNHRVHHAVNTEYIDKNIGGLFMIFDHIFGTYQCEVAEPTFGITHNLSLQKPQIILFHEYKKMKIEIRCIKSISKKIRYLFSPPGD